MISCKRAVIPLRQIRRLAKTPAGVGASAGSKVS
jgi:hypothetical protein